MGLKRNYRSWGSVTYFANNNNFTETFEGFVPKGIPSLIFFRKLVHKFPAREWRMYTPYFLLKGEIVHPSQLWRKLLTYRIYWQPKEDSIKVNFRYSPQWLTLKHLLPGNRIKFVSQDGGIQFCGIRFFPHYFLFIRVNKCLQFADNRRVL